MSLSTLRNSSNVKCPCTDPVASGWTFCARHGVHVWLVGATSSDQISRLYCKCRGNRHGQLKTTREPSISCRNCGAMCGARCHGRSPLCYPCSKNPNRDLDEDVLQYVLPNAPPETTIVPASKRWPVMAAASNSDDQDGARPSKVSAADFVANLNAQNLLAPDELGFTIGLGPDSSFYRCGLCGSTSSNSSAAREHAKKHCTEDKSLARTPFVYEMAGRDASICPWCDETFNPVTFKRHINQHHADKLKDPAERRKMFFNVRSSWSTWVGGGHADRLIHAYDPKRKLEQPKPLTTKAKSRKRKVNAPPPLRKKPARPKPKPTESAAASSADTNQAEPLVVSRAPAELTIEEEREALAVSRAIEHAIRPQKEKMSLILRPRTAPIPNPEYLPLSSSDYGVEPETALPEQDCDNDAAEHIKAVSLDNVNLSSALTAAAQAIDEQDAVVETNASPRPLNTSSASLCGASGSRSDNDAPRVLKPTTPSPRAEEQVDPATSDPITEMIEYSRALQLNDRLVHAFVVLSGRSKDRVKPWSKAFSAIDVSSVGDLRRLDKKQVADIIAPLKQSAIMSRVIAFVRLEFDQ